ncbi:MAG: ferrous iron transport protein A [Sterolibacterium sp.]|jgi:ferrous iron transport protein A|nr:ferrous iron transport protein A [Sterolibacterium sp.]
MKTQELQEARVPRKLDDLIPGQTAVIESVHVDEALHHRLSALGFRVERTVQLLRRGICSGPLHVRLGATDVMLRQTEARRISVSVSVSVSAAVLPGACA